MFNWVDCVLAKVYPGEGMPFSNSYTGAHGAAEVLIGSYPARRPPI